ncbi:MAG: AAA family ATPase, partial [Thermodesulfobacteriota bacterium]
MLPIDFYTPRQKHLIQEAGSYFFPPDNFLDQGFFKKIKPEHVKEAYIKQARYYQEERKKDIDPARMEKIESFLSRMKDSYEILTSFFQQKYPQARESETGRILAVGGAKGGIGKSIFVANLSVFLAARGYRTIAVDLDLGGANLSLYLGEKFIPERTINDYLKKKYTDLSDIAFKSESGPWIIGGDSSELGIANIDYARKMKLIRAVQALEADYVILDLGGDTSFNILDFFLISDYPIVLTTRSSASYIGAYQFIKTALYRKLNRLTSPDSDKKQIKNQKLASFLKDFSFSGSGQPAVKNISELMNRVAENDPLDIPDLAAAVVSFSPYLVVNRVSDETEAGQVAKDISGLAR